MTIRSLCNCTGSFDHRIVSGAQAGHQGIRGKGTFSVPRGKNARDRASVYRAGGVCRRRLLSRKRWVYARRRNERRVAVRFFGDGATKEGAFHEGLNMAPVYGLPAVIICEKNRQSRDCRRITETGRGGGRNRRRHQQARRGVLDFRKPVLHGYGIQLSHQVVSQSDTLLRRRPHRRHPPFAGQSYFVESRPGPAPPDVGNETFHLF